MKLNVTPVLVAALLIATSAAQAVELKVLSGNGPRAAVRALLASKAVAFPGKGASGIYSSACWTA